MAIKGDGLKFYPLYWIFHDQWQYYDIDDLGRVSNIHDHWGHMHFFMLGFPATSKNADAFEGLQRYNFKLQDIWGPRSIDFNQQQNYTIVGKPKWYFYVEEIWRRVYIHTWSQKQPDDTPITGRRGVKYDASPRDKTAGPFREGRDPMSLKAFMPYWSKFARTLPVEYYHDAQLSQANRDNHVADRARSLLPIYAQAKYNQVIADGGTIDDATAQARKIYDERTFNLQHPAFFEKKAFPDPAKPPFSDMFYIWPIIEYQHVVQLNWERLPGAAPEGDGFEMSLTIPFIHPQTKKYKSPFGREPGECDPVGVYHNTNIAGEPLVPESKQPHYASVSYKPDDPQADREYQPPLDQPPGTSGKLIKSFPLPSTEPDTAFHNPYGAHAGGKWVQQCLGGIVRARIKLTIRHRLGGTREVWVQDMQYIPATPFSGTDQGQGAHP